jgi:hypothetical protein
MVALAEESGRAPIAIEVAVRKPQSGVGVSGFAGASAQGHTTRSG